MRVFAQAVAEGTADGDAALMMAYGVYLMNGGRREDFMELTADDVQIMLTTYLGTQARQASRLARAIWPKTERA